MLVKMPVKIFTVFFAFMLASQFSCSQNSDPFFALRNRMVKTQIEARGITDEKVLNALRKVERHNRVGLPGSHSGRVVRFGIYHRNF
jgi:hypothetical protein